MMRITIKCIDNLLAANYTKAKREDIYESEKHESGVILFFEKNKKEVDFLTRPCYNSTRTRLFLFYKCVRKHVI